MIIIIKAILKKICDQVTLYEIDGAAAISHNRALVEPQKRPLIRDVFFHMLGEKDYDSIIQRHFHKRFRNRKIKKLLKLIMPPSLYKRYFKD